MSISAATNHLARMLILHYEKKNAASVVTFLGRVSLIGEYVERKDLASWEGNVLSLEGIGGIEQRADFPLLELVWEVGRSNLFGQINEEETKKIYDEARTRMNQDFCLEAKSSDCFDFSKW